MGIQRSQEDSWTKEMAKWEQRPVLVAGTFIQPIPMDQGGHANLLFHEYPKRLYKAEAADGGPQIVDDNKTVHDEGQERVAIGQGWCVSQEDAIAAVHARHVDLGKLAANRNYNDRLMSDKARAESQAVEETSSVHLPVIPVTPIRKRRTKAEMAASRA